MAPSWEDKLNAMTEGIGQSQQPPASSSNDWQSKLDSMTDYSPSPQPASYQAQTKQPEPTRPPFEDAFDYNKQSKAAGNWLSWLSTADKPIWEKALDVGGKGLEGLNWWQQNVSPEILAKGVSALSETDPARLKYAEEHPKEYWEQVAKERLPYEGFLTKGILEAAVDPTSYIGLGVAGKLPVVGKVLGPLDKAAGRVLGAPVELPLRAAGKILKATPLGQLSKGSELRAYETQATEAVARWTEAGKTLDDLKTVAKGDVTPLADLDNQTAAFVRDNARDIETYTDNLRRDAGALSKTKQTWTTLHPEAADRITNAVTQPEIEQLAAEFGSTVEKNKIAKMFREHGDVMANPNDLTYVVSQLRRNKQRDLGIKGPGPIARSFDNATSLLKEAWLPLSVSFHLTNFVDNTAHGIIEGVAPHTGATITQRASAIGLPVPSDIGSGYVENTLGKNKKGLSLTNIPVLGGAIQKGKETGAWVEHFWRYSTWWKGAQQYLKERNPAFFDSLQNELTRSGVTSDVAQGIVTSIRQSGTFKADDIVAVFQRFEKPQVPMPLNVVGPTTPLDSAALNTFAQKLSQVDLTAGETAAKSQVDQLVAATQQGIAEEARAIRGLPEDADKWLGWQSTKMGKILDAVQNADNPEQAMQMLDVLIKARQAVDALSKTASENIKRAKTTPTANWQQFWDARNQQAMDVLNALDETLAQMPTPKIAEGEYMDRAWGMNKVRQEIATARRITDPIVQKAQQEVHGPGGLIDQIERAKALYKKRTKKDMESWNPTRKVAQLDAKIEEVYETSHKKYRQSLQIAYSKIRKALEDSIEGTFTGERTLQFGDEGVRGPNLYQGQEGRVSIGAALNLGGGAIGAGVAYDPNASPEENAMRMAAGGLVGVAGMQGVKAARESLPEAGRVARTLATGERGSLQLGGFTGKQAKDLETAMFEAKARGATADEIEAIRTQYMGSETPATKRYYHGTGSAFDAPEAGKFDPNGLYGPGYYMTDNADVAGSYALSGVNTSFGTNAAKSQLEEQIGFLEKQRASALANGRMAHAAEIEKQLMMMQPNIRPIDVPQGLKMLDVSQPASPEVMNLVSQVTRKPLREMTGGQAWTEMATTDQLPLGAPGTAARSANANKQLSNLGYDGIRYQGGNVIPLKDAAGKPIQHEAVVIFPESLHKITNALSKTQGGQAQIGPALDIGSGAVGAAASYDPNASPEENAARMAAGGLVGAGLMHAGRKGLAGLSVEDVGKGKISAARVEPPAPITAVEAPTVPPAAPEKPRGPTAVVSQGVMGEGRPPGGYRTLLQDMDAIEGDSQSWRLVKDGRELTPMAQNKLIQRIAQAADENVISLTERDDLLDEVVANSGERFDGWKPQELIDYQRGNYKPSGVPEVVEPAMTERELHEFNTAAYRKPRPETPVVTPETPVQAGQMEFVRPPTKAEKVGGTARQRGYNAIPDREGLDKVYMPYGEKGAGYYYQPVEATAQREAERIAQANDVAPTLPEKTPEELIGKTGEKVSIPVSVRPEPNADIKVPGDGTVTVYSQEQANNLHKILTGESLTQQGEKYSITIRQAFEDWHSGRAYIDNKGTWRLKEVQPNGSFKSSGLVAPWNKEVKATFKNADEFHKASQEPRPTAFTQSVEAPTVPTEPAARVEPPAPIPSDLAPNPQSSVVPVASPELQAKALEDYRISHRPNAAGPRAFDLTEGDLVPADVYVHPEWYVGDPNSKEAKESIAAIRRIRGNPNAMVTIYRSAPAGSEINPGDWVSLSKEYARLAGLHATDKAQDLPVIMKRVRAADVRFAGDDLNEFGYFPTEQTKATKPPILAEASDAVPTQPLPAPEAVTANGAILTPETATTPPTAGAAGVPPSEPPRPPAPPRPAAPGPEPTPPRSVELADVRAMMEERRQAAQMARQNADRLAAETEQRNMLLLDAWRQSIEQAITQGIPVVQQSAAQIAALKAARIRAVQMVRQLAADASRYGNDEQKRTFFDYAARTNMDELLQKVSPFTIWQTRNIPWYLQQMLQKPALGRTYVATQQESQKQQEQANLTGRFKNNVRLGPLDALAGIATGRPGSQMWGTPQNTVMSIGQQIKEPYNAEGATEVGKGINLARTVLGGLSLYPWLQLPLQAAGVFGDQPYSDILPQSRLVRAATGALGNRVDPEAFWKDRLTKAQGQPAVGSSTIEDYYIGKRLAEMVQAGEITQSQAYRAMDNPTDPLWKQAQTAVQSESDLMGALRYFMPVNMKTLTPEEASIRTARGEMPEYSPNMTDAEKAQRSAVYTANPGISTMNAISESPEKRTILAQQSEYYSLGTPAMQAAYAKIPDGVPPKDRGKYLTSKEVQLTTQLDNLRRKFLGDPNNASFADFHQADSQAKGALTLDDYLTAQGIPTDRRESLLAKTAGTQNPPARQVQTQNPQLISQNTGQATQYYQLKQQLNDAFDQYNSIGDERSKALSEQYMALPKGAARTTWIKNNPQSFQTLQTYWNQRDAVAAQSPILATYFQWLDTNPTIPAGQTKTDTFLKQYKPSGSMGGSSQSNATFNTSAVGSTAYPRTATGASRTYSGSSYSPRTAPVSPTSSWDNFAAKAGPQLTQELEANFRQNTPLTPEGTAYLQALYQRDNMGTTTFEAFVQKIKGLYYARGKRANMPYWMQKILGYAK